MATDGIDLTDEQRAAARRVAASDNPFSSVAQLLCYLDTSSAAASSESASSDSTSVTS